MPLCAPMYYALCTVHYALYNINSHYIHYSHQFHYSLRLYTIHNIHYPLTIHSPFPT
ncbi:hypothetical protein B484DRAFT_460351, partial [Ochromonadaceae sp. CCMP2298]